MQVAGQQRLQTAADVSRREVLRSQASPASREAVSGAFATSARRERMLKTQQAKRARAVEQAAKACAGVDLPLS